MISLSTVLYRAVAWVLAALASAGLPVRLRGGANRLHAGVGLQFHR